MRKMKTGKFIGRRIIKTGIAVFITAFICLQLNLPAEFAVIAAIVTIEPTAFDSIRKGVIRFPASAIGAAFAVIFVALWGETVLSYTLAAVFTIFLCQKLKLNDGILVATLTAVAMVPDINGHFILTFLSRLGTTTIGITVSTLVNFLILPPKFTPLINEKLKATFLLASEVLSKTMQGIIESNPKRAINPTYLKFRNTTEKVSELLSFQEREWKYHKIKISEYRNFYKLKKMNTIMQKIALHIGNLQYVNEPGHFTMKEKEVIIKSVQSIQLILENPSNSIPEDHYKLIGELDFQLRYEANQLSKSSQFFHHFTTKRIVYFELLSIHDSLEELYQINAY
ncbi:hypothetical protein BKP45_01295 [Anaerobacillus alkalidiazotrophicus]|uniref:Aromatic acid exporter family protein n=2 Tax=Anaerobacillus alkalidiazotrophicus TaxID=472963 RepID=A0A1S2MCR6_9BACI|nr:hypothetical protein BKP45_01295 [Anaerobacillus alkalidiazotrophicus]